MRLSHLLVLSLATACSATLYSRYAGPAAGTPDEVYSCVQGQLKTLGYVRAQYDSAAKWYLAKKIVKDQVSSGLYRHTIEMLETKVKVSNEGEPTLDITARTFEEFATARGEDQQERKASDRVQIDARTLGKACAK